MRRTIAILCITVIASLMQIAPASAAPSRLIDLVSADAVLRWINAYRGKPDPDGVPTVVLTLSRFGAFKDPETAGAYVGFIAGVIAANPNRADELIAKMLALPPSDHWVIVRAIAYSAHPQWQQLLVSFSDRMPARKVMIERYLAGKMPTLWQVASRKSPSTWESLRSKTIDKLTGAEPHKDVVLDASPDILDTFWGYYFGSGSRRPLGRIVAMLPLSRDNESADKITLGGMAKYTLANNAARDAQLLEHLKSLAPYQPPEVTPILKDVIEAAETVDSARVRREALASIEELRRKGPGFHRDVTFWGQVGQGVLAAGCIAAAATGQVELGLPCVVAGGVSSAALSFWDKQQ
jgi:hypothetical protein